jgi:hypothetical protein
MMRSLTEKQIEVSVSVLRTGGVMQQNGAQIAVVVLDGC